MCDTQNKAHPIQVIFSDRLAKPVGPFSPAVRSDAPGHIFVSGQIGQSADTGKLVEGGIERETEQVLANLAAVLESSDCSFSDVVRATLYLTYMADFAAVNSIYAKYFKTPYPARTIAVAALPLGASVEIDVIAAAGGAR
jgi:2-iminobutanoate/2-iminopropanoate deaminase